MSGLVKTNFSVESERSCLFVCFHRDTRERGGKERKGAGKRGKGLWKRFHSSTLYIHH